MPKLRNFSSLFVVALVLGLSACGGGGPGTAVESTPTPPPAPPPPAPPPPPPPPPPPAQTILSAAKTSQEFASKGATYAGMNRANPLVADADQLRLRYDAASNTYEIRLPSTSTWVRISPTADAGVWSTAGSTTTIVAGSGDSATLVRWSAANSFGVTAVAIPTSASAVPTNGSATYAGELAGYTSENLPYLDTNLPGRISGTINLAFDFGTGGLSGTIQARMSSPRGPFFTLPTLALRDTVHAVGSPNFSGRFDTNVAGLNSFSGIFAGPTAGNVAGSFAFPYLSPSNGAVQQASGAFVGSVSTPSSP